MSIDEIREHIIEVEREISALPASSIITKKVKNGTYYYHRITVNGKRKETYLDSGYAIELRALIEKSKSIEKEPKSLKAFLPKEAASSVEYLNVEDYLRKL